MALWSNNKEFIFKAVEEMYTDVASRPGAVFHFPTGHSACLFVGYPAEQLDSLPVEATESFAGVGYPFAADVIRPGDTVLDIGSGSGTDTLIAAMLTGPSGVVYGLDMTRAMREKLQRIVTTKQIGTRPRARRERRADSASGRERRCGHQQRRAEPRARQAGRVRRNRSSAQARWSTADCGHRAPGAGIGSVPRRSAALGRVRRRRDHRGRLRLALACCWFVGRGAQRNGLLRRQRQREHAPRRSRPRCSCHRHAGMQT